MPDNAGNTLSDARTIVINSNVQSWSDRVDGSDPNDYYRFSLSSASTINLSLTGLSADADVELLNSAGVVIARGSNGGSMAESILYNATAAGTYFVRVYQYGNAQTDYQLSLFTTGQNSTSSQTSSTTQTGSGTQIATGDDFSANTGTLGRLAIGSNATGNIEVGSDTDWFKVSLTDRQTVQFDLEGSPTGRGTLGDTYIRGIYNSSGVLLTNTSNDDFGGNSNSRVTFTAPNAGDYFISAGAYSGTGTYRLTATGIGNSTGTSTSGTGTTTQTGTGTQTTTGDDYSANTGTFGRLAIGSNATGNIEVGSDTDWFKVSLTDRQTVQFDLEGSPTGRGTLGDTYIRGIYNSSGVLLANTSNDDFGGNSNSRVTFTAPGAGDYFISAGAYSGTGTYRLTATSIGNSTGTSTSGTGTTTQTGTTTVSTANSLTSDQTALLNTLKANFDAQISKVSSNYNANVNNANLYPSNSSLAADYNGECVSYVKLARTDLAFAWGGSAKYGGDTADRMGFHVDAAIPIIGSAFIIAENNREVSSFTSLADGHTGIVRDVNLVRSSVNGVLQYEYQLSLRDSNGAGTHAMRDGTGILDFPSQNGWTFIWGTDAEYELDRGAIQATIGRLYDANLLSHSVSRDTYTNDPTLINRFFLLNSAAKYSNFMNLIELHNVEIGRAPNLYEIRAWNMTNDVLAGAQVGSSAANNLIGTAGSDILIGGTGNDTLTGGQGADVFKFITQGGGRDTITDFESGRDKIEIVSQYFANIAIGNLNASAFKLAGSALTSNAPVFIYNANSGILSFDADGNGSGGAIEIAILTGQKSLVAGDIQIVGA